MIQHAKQKYVGKKYRWHGKEIEITNCFSCYDGDFFEYYFTNDANKQIERVSLFDEEFMKILQEPEASFVNKTFLIGINFVDSNGKLIEQYQTSGKVIELSDDGLLKIEREDNTVFQIPYDEKATSKTPKGEYRENSSGKIIVNPDYITQWTVTTKNNIDRIDEIKNTGFIGFEKKTKL